jgi:hypothetical protein
VPVRAFGAYEQPAHRARFARHAGRKILLRTLSDFDLNNRPTYAKFHLEVNSVYILV